MSWTISYSPPPWGDTISPPADQITHLGDNLERVLPGYQWDTVARLFSGTRSVTVTAADAERIAAVLREAGPLLRLTGWKTLCDRLAESASCAAHSTTGWTWTWTDDGR